MECEPKTVLFDFGGVYYTEGFREGLFAIARKYRVKEPLFYETAMQTIFANGYIRGEAPEHLFWEDLAREAGLSADLFEERNLILEAFEPLPGMRSLVVRTGERVPVGLLTDNCNWLYELDERDGFMTVFDAVISSYEEGFTKKDPEIFRIACQRMDVLPGEAVFFDDNMGNISLARDFGMKAYLFEDPAHAQEILKREGLIV